MGKDKVRRWKENKSFPHVFEPDLQEIVNGMKYMNGQWREKVFGNDCPLVLELGCGKGEYSVGQARLFPENNYLGVDIKGHRFWKGAKASLAEGMNNVAFLRTRIEFIANFFDAEEVDEIWLTFSDPQPKDEKGSKRLTSPKFIERYKQFLKKGGVIHVKTDNTMLYEYTLGELQKLEYNIETFTSDLYGPYFDTLDDAWKKVMSIRTHYEQLFMDQGETIKYIRFTI